MQADGQENCHETRPRTRPQSGSPAAYHLPSHLHNIRVLQRIDTRIVVMLQCDPGAPKYRPSGHQPSALSPDNGFQVRGYAPSEIRFPCPRSDT